MVAACPSCRARYRVDVERVPADGARLRCTRCQTVFRVRPPDRDPAPAAEAPPPQPAPPPRPRVAPPMAPAPASPSPDAKSGTAPEEAGRLVLVAHPEAHEAKRIGDAISGWGLDVKLAHDGVEAILGIQRAMPRLVVLDAALPKMFGFQVCELVKRNESLRHIAVVLVGAIHDQDRYRRTPNDLYGADAYLERQQLPDALAPLLRDLGLERRRDAPASGAPQVEAPPPPPADSGERASAERLARIIVSDIVLYNAERFEAGIRQGEVLSAMSAELSEGRGLLAQRVGPEVDVAGLLEVELLRVARARGMR